MVGILKLFHGKLAAHPYKCSGEYEKLPPHRIPTVGIVQVPSTRTQLSHKHHHHGELLLRPDKNTIVRFVCFRQICLILAGGTPDTTKLCYTHTSHIISQPPLFIHNETR